MKCSVIASYWWKKWEAKWRECERNDDVDLRTDYVLCSCRKFQENSKKVWAEKCTKIKSQGRSFKRSLFQTRSNMYSWVNQRLDWTVANRGLNSVYVKRSQITSLKPFLVLDRLATVYRVVGLTQDRAWGQFNKEIQVSFTSRTLVFTNSHQFGSTKGLYKFPLEASSLYLQ